jgi:nitrate reductase cytochrome c-type subunit
MIRPALLSLAATLPCLFAGALFAQQIGGPGRDAPRLKGPEPFTRETPAPPMQRQVTDDVRRRRNYPDQPPLIPHSIEGYALDLNANKCLSCRARKFTEQSQAPMDKIARKMQASKEVWGHIFGSIDTRDKFLALRKHLAEREWERMKANDSLECRNCHSSESMDLTKQNPRAAQAHERSLFSGEKTCIDCHKGIAHKLPNMSGVPGWQ